MILIERKDCSLEVSHGPWKKGSPTSIFQGRVNCQSWITSNFMGYIHMSSTISRMFPSSCLGSFLKCLRDFCPQVGRFGILRLFVEKNSAPKYFNFVSVSMDILKKQPRSSQNFWTSEKKTNPEIAELQWSVRLHNQDTTDAGKWGIYWDSRTKTLWMRHS